MNRKNAGSEPRKIVKIARGRYNMWSRTGGVRALNGFCGAKWGCLGYELPVVDANWQLD